MNLPKILLVEDDPNLGNVLKEFLEIKGYKIELRTDGISGLQAFQQQAFDLCLLDVMLPRQDGFALCKKIRVHNHQVPILFITAKTKIEDKVEGFAIGADDYLTKPFSMIELNLRIQALLKRSEVNQPETAENTQFQIGLYHFDFQTRTLTFKNENTKITSKEADLLRILCQYMNRVLPRETALRNVWGNDDYYTARSMDVFITRLRKYLKNDPSIEIQNIHSTGFKLTVTGQ